MSLTIVDRMREPGAATSMTFLPRLENDDSCVSFDVPICAYEETVTTSGSSVGMSRQPLLMVRSIGVLSFGLLAFVVLRDRS